jgi:DNA-binding MarR family transcriptional regulator
VGKAGPGTSALVDLVNLVTQVIWADLRQSNATIELTQWATLRRIARGPCTMSELARHKGVSLPTISKSIEMLVRRGLVERWVDNADRRQTLVRLTARGRRTLADCRRRIEELLDAKLSALPAAERDILAASLQNVLRVLGPEAGDRRPPRAYRAARTRRKPRLDAPLDTSPLPRLPTR